MALSPIRLAARSSLSALRKRKSMAGSVSITSEVLLRSPQRSQSASQYQSPYVGDHPWSGSVQRHRRQGRTHPRTQEAPTPSGPCATDGAATRDRHGKVAFFLNTRTSSAPSVEYLLVTLSLQSSRNSSAPEKCCSPFGIFPWSRFMRWLSKRRRRLSAPGRQGKFWQMHDLASSGNQLSPAGLEAQAASLG